MKHFFSRTAIIMMALFAWASMAHATGFTIEEPISIVVQKGNTLSQIAKHFDTTWKVLQKINGIKNPHLIYPNDVIVIAHGPERGTNALPVHKTLKAKKARVHAAKNITPASFLWKNPGKAPCIKCTVASSVRGLEFPDVVASALVAKVKNRDFTMIKIARGMHFDAMYFGKRIRKENVIASWKRGHTELAREYSVIHEGTRYALIYPLVCGNWSKATSIASPPTPAAVESPEQPESIPESIPEQACITCPDLIVLATFEPLDKREPRTNENADN